MKTSRHKAVAAALFAVFTVQSAAPVFAHNERIHQGMTDYAYHLTLAMAAVSAGDTTSNPLVAELAAMLNDDPDLPSFFSAAEHAVPKLRHLRSGLLDDPAPCFDNDVQALVDDDNDLLPDWQLLAPTTLAEQRMGRLVYPDHHEVRQQERRVRDRQDLQADRLDGVRQSRVGFDAERKIPIARLHRRDARLLGRRTRSRAEGLDLPVDDAGDAPDSGASKSAPGSASPRWPWPHVPSPAG